jgi:effector-binding domain-containing protein
MIGPAKIDERPEQAYMGWRTVVPMSELPRAIPQGLDTVFGYLGEQGVPPTGAPFIRYHVINMADHLDIELAVPVAGPVAASDQVRPGVLPAGRYASLIYRDIKEGMPANAALLEWIAQQGLACDRWDEPAGDAFASRYERFLSGPQDDPDPANWDSEVAIKLADG